MKTTVHAEWASEEKMRDGMHMSATLDIYTLGMFWLPFILLFFGKYAHTKWLCLLLYAAILRARIKAVKDYCEKHEGLTKWLGLQEVLALEHVENSPIRLQVITSPYHLQVGTSPSQVWQVRGQDAFLGGTRSDGPVWIQQDEDPAGTGELWHGWAWFDSLRSLGTHDPQHGWCQEHVIRQGPHLFPVVSQ